MKVKVTIPESLADIKLSQYQKYVRTTEGKEDSNYINRQLITIFCNVPDNYIGKIKQSDYESMIDQVQAVLNTQHELMPIIKHNGKDYGFIPDGFENITVDELADLDNYIKDVQSYHKAMAVLYRPIKAKLQGKYLIEDYNPTGEGLDISMDAVSGALVFFSSLIRDLLNYTQNSIQEAVNQDKTLQSLVESGVGISHFMDWQKEIFSDLRKLVS